MAIGDYLARTVDADVAKTLMSKYGPTSSQPEIGPPDDTPQIGPPNTPQPMVGPPNDMIGPPDSPKMGPPIAPPAPRMDPAKFKALMGKAEADLAKSHASQGLRAGPPQMGPPLAPPPEETDEAGSAVPDAPPGQNYSPGHLVGAKWVPGTRSETVQHGIDESKLEPGQRLRAEGLNHAEWSLDKTQEAAAREAQGDVAYAAAHAQATQEAAERAQRIENEKQAYTIREHEKLDALNTAAQAQVDPEAAKGSMGSQILAALSVGLGQFGASLNGGTNTALQIVNGNIDRRIAAQQHNIANAHKSLSNEQSLYKDNLAAFGDKERASLATKMQYIDQAKAQLDQVYASQKNTRNEAQYHAMREGLDEKYAGYADQFGIRTADQRTTTGNEHFAPAHMEGGGAAGKDLPNIVTGSDGTSYQMPNEKEHGRAVEQIQVMNRLQRYNNEALRTRGRLDKLNPVTDRTKYQTEMKTLEDLEEDKAALISTGLGQGVLRDSEYLRSVKRQGFYTQGVGTMNAVNPLAKSERDSADNNIRRQIARGDEDQKSFIRDAGGHIVKRGYTHDAAGNVSPAARYTGQDVKPVEQLPAKGFRPMDKTKEAPTAGDPDSETTPRAPDFGLQQNPTAAPAGKGGKGGGSPHVKKRK